MGWMEWDDEPMEATSYESCLSWTIEGFSDLHGFAMHESPDIVPSEFELDGAWCVQVWPNGRSAEDEGHVSFCLRYRGSLEDPIDVRYQVSVYKGGNLTHHSQKITVEWLTIVNHYNDRRGSSTEPHQLIQRAEVLSESGLLNDGELQLHVKIWKEGTAEPVCRHEVPASPIEDPLDDVHDLPTRDPHSYVFKDLYKDRTYADMTVEVGGQRFKIHKIVFALRSPVFERMLNIDMSETKNGCVVFSDITPEVYTSLDEYMYTGRVTDLDKYALQLLDCAEKYDLKRLERLCELSLEQNLSEDNVLDNLVLVDLYRDLLVLKYAAMEFITLHRQAVMTSEKWSFFRNNHPELAAEVIDQLTTEAK